MAVLGERRQGPEGRRKIIQYSGRGLGLKGQHVEPVFRVIIRGQSILGEAKFYPTTTTDYCPKCNKYWPFELVRDPHGMSPNLCPNCANETYPPSYLNVGFGSKRYHDEFHEGINTYGCPYCSNVKSFGSF